MNLKQQIFECLALTDDTPTQRSSWGWNVVLRGSRDMEMDARSCRSPSSCAVHSDAAHSRITPLALLQG